MPARSIKIVGGADETFFNEMIIVFMDLTSGYIFVEETANDRCYETWKDKVQSIVDKFGIKIEYIVSDRAKALIKLAEKGFGCLSIPDLFHASNEIVKVLLASYSPFINSTSSEELNLENINVHSY